MLTLKNPTGSRSKFSPTGHAVRILQGLLHLDEVDGLFYGGTESAVKAFQKRNGLAPDGIVGFSTWSKLFANRSMDGVRGIEHAIKPKAKFSQSEFDRDKASRLLPLWGYNARPRVKEAFEKVLPVIEPYLASMHLASPEQWIAFAGTARQETGSNFSLVENLNYKCSALPKIFSAFRSREYNHPKYGHISGYSLAKKVGRCSGHSADQVEIANYAYANRKDLGTGSPESGDGWRTRGSGIKQTTGVKNQTRYHDWLKKDYPDLYKATHGERILTLGADAIKESPHNILSGIFFWVDNKLYEGVEKHGLTRKASDFITKRVNPHTSSYSKRYAHMKKGIQLMGIA